MCGLCMSVCVCMCACMPISPCIYIHICLSMWVSLFLRVSIWWGRSGGDGGRVIGRAKGSDGKWDWLPLPLGTNISADSLASPRLSLARSLAPLTPANVDGYSCTRADMGKRHQLSAHQYSSTFFSFLCLLPSLHANKHNMHAYMHTHAYPHPHSHPHSTHTHDPFLSTTHCPPFFSPCFLPSFSPSEHY